MSPLTSLIKQMRWKIVIYVLADTSKIQMCVDVFTVIVSLCIIFQQSVMLLTLAKLDDSSVLLISLCCLIGTPNLMEHENHPGQRAILKMHSVEI